MKPQEVIEFLNTIEGKFPVDRWVIDEIHIWPLIRIQLMNELNNYNIGVRERQKTKFSQFEIVKILYQVFYGLPKYCCSYLADYKHNNYPKIKAEVVFLTHTMCRMFSFDKRKYDVLCEPIASLFKQRNLSSFLIEIPHNNEFRIPRHNKSMFIYPQQFLWEIKSGLLSHKDPYFLEHKSFEECVRFIDSSFSVKVINLFSLYKKIWLLRLRTEYFKKIFKTINPSMGFVVQYDSNIGMAFVLACHEWGIPSVDIQHGLQNHPAYIRWMKVPERGYSLLPSLFWVWSQEEEGHIKEWTDKVSNFHKPLVGGNVLLNTFKDDHNELVEHFDHQINAIIKERLIEFTILVTLQPGGGVPAIIKKAIEILPGSWFWWIRLHPGMIPDRKNIYSELRVLNKRNWDLDNASKLPIYALLKNVDLHITQFSSSVIDAVHFGVPSIVTHQNGVEYFRKNILEREAFVSLTLTSLISTIKMIKNQHYKVKCSRFNSYLSSDEVIEQIIREAKLKPNKS